MNSYGKRYFQRAGAAIVCVLDKITQFKSLFVEELSNVFVYSLENIINKIHHCVPKNENRLSFDPTAYIASQMITLTTQVLYVYIGKKMYYTI